MSGAYALKRLLLFCFVLLCATLSAFGQTTTSVTATVVDPAAQPYANGTWSVQFHPNGFPPNIYNVNGAPFTQKFSGPLDAAGTFNVTLTSNTAMVPVGASWDFTVCPNVDIPCTTATTAVSGSSQNVSSVINAALPPTQVKLQPHPNAGPLARAYNDNEIQSPVTGTAYFNVGDSCTHVFNGLTWASTCGGGTTGLPSTLPNCTASGTVLNTGVEFSTQLVNGSQALCAKQASANSQTTIAVCSASCGNSGLATLVYSGLTPAILDGQGVAGDYLIPSATPGWFTDIGSTKPSGTVETFGIVATVNTGSGTTAQIYVQPLSLYSPGTSSNSGNVNNSPQFRIPFYSSPGSANVLSGDTGCTTDGSGNPTCNSLTINGGGIGQIKYGVGTKPAAPSSGLATTFVNSATNQFDCELSNGTSCAPGAGSNYSAISNGLLCDNTTNDTAALSTLLTTIGSAQATIQFPLSRKCVIGTITIPTNVMLDFSPGAAFSIVTGQTVNIRGGISNPDNHQIFFNANSGTTGTIDFTNNVGIVSVYPEWWGASNSATATTNTVALQNAIYGAFGCGPVISCRTNGSGLWKWNKTLRLTQNFSVNAQLNFYHVINFKIDCSGRLNSGITQTATNTEIIDGQSDAYGVFYDCAWSTTANQDLSHPLMSIDFDGSQGVDIKPQFLDFFNNNWGGNGSSKIGFQLARSGGGAQGSSIHFYNNAALNFSEAAFMIGNGSGGVSTAIATNTIEVQWRGGDIQNCPAYGIENFGGGSLLINGTTFEDGFATQTGYDIWSTQLPAGEWNTTENVRSESRRLIGGGSNIVRDSFVNDQGVVPGQGSNFAVGTIITGSPWGGDGAYYKITVQGAFGGLGTVGSPRTASAGSATTITDSVGGLTVNAYIGFQVTIIGGTGGYEYCVVTSNTASVLTCAAGWTSRFSVNLNPSLVKVFTTIVNPDATSTFIVEPHWGSQTTSGGATWTAVTDEWVEGLFMANNVFIPGAQISLDYRSKLTNVKFTRADWLDAASQAGLISPGAINAFNGVLVVDQNNTNQSYRTWGFGHPDLTTSIQNYSFDQHGGVPVCWAGGVNTPSNLTKDDECVGINGTGSLNVINNSANTLHTTSFVQDGSFQISTVGQGNGVLALAGNTSGTATFTAPATAGTRTNAVTSSNNLIAPSLTAGGTAASTANGTATVASATNAGQLFLGSDAAVNIFRNTNNNLQISTTGSAGVQFLGSGGIAFASGKGQHFNTQAANNDLAGTCTAAAATTCTVTFTTAYTAAPACVAVDATNITTLKVTPSTTSLVITTSAASSDVFDYICHGNPN